MESRIEIPVTYLHNGDNVLAVEVHQYTTDSSDIVWGAKLEAMQSGITEVVLRQVDTPPVIAALADNLRITEVMYRPAGNSAAEYIKLQNVGATPLQLHGARLNGGVDFIFPNMILNPGEYTVVVRDTATFIATYGSGISIAGQYTGNLANEGEEIVLQLPDPYGNGILRFTYSPTWYPATNGGGQALGIRDIHAAAASWDTAAGWNAVFPNWGTNIVDRRLFYHNSKFDATTDDNAIATDKQALLPGHTATFANYTSYSRGINGIMVDIAGLANPGSISAADFQFQVGNGGAWTAAPAPNNVFVRQGAGVGGSDRVTITWDDNVIQNQWLQVTVKATANTGLAAADVFYFGNAIGESGDNPANAVVDFQDELASRTHKSGIPIAPITNPYDYNRDGRVNATDDIIVRHNRTDGTSGNPLQLISAPVGAPLAAGDALQSLPLSPVVEIAPLQTATASMDIAVSQSVPLSPVEIISTSSAKMSPVAVEIILASAASTPAQSPFITFSRSSVGTQVPGFLHLQDMAGYSSLFGSSFHAGTSDQLVPTPERGNQILTLEHRHRTSRPVSSQDNFHDAVLARSITWSSFTEENSLPDDSFAPVDIETFYKDCLPLKSGKSLAQVIDTVMAAARHQKD